VHALSHCHCGKNLPKLPKFAKIFPKLISLRNFKIPAKIEILMFSKKEPSICRRNTKACAQYLDFNTTIFYMIFLSSKKYLSIQISTYSLVGKKNYSQCSTSLVGMRFFKHVPNSLKNNEMKRYIPYLLKKMVFLDSKTLMSTLDIGEKTFSLTLNVTIFQTIKNDCVRFGGHVDIEVSYKILLLEVLKNNPILHYSPCLQ
jgi:hypothetical protein